MQNVAQTLLDNFVVAIRYSSTKLVLPVFTLLPNALASPTIAPCPYPELDRYGLLVVFITSILLIVCRYIQNTAVH